jgi:hypothetical protein
MNIEDLVYKTGSDGKPKKPKKTAKSTAGRAAGDFAAAVKAELDAKQSAINKLSGLSSSDRLAARLNDAKGQPKVRVLHLQPHESIPRLSSHTARLINLVVCSLISFTHGFSVCLSPTPDTEHGSRNSVHRQRRPAGPSWHHTGAC